MSDWTGKRIQKRNTKRLGTVIEDPQRYESILVRYDGGSRNAWTFKSSVDRLDDAGTVTPGQVWTRHTSGARFFVKRADEVSVTLLHEDVPDHLHEGGAFSEPTGRLLRNYTKATP